MFADSYFPDAYFAKSYFPSSVGSGITPPVVEAHDRRRREIASSPWVILFILGALNV